MVKKRAVVFTLYYLFDELGGRGEVGGTQGVVDLIFQSHHPVPLFQVLVEVVVAALQQHRPFPAQVSIKCIKQLLAFYKREFESKVDLLLFGLFKLFRKVDFTDGKVKEIEEIDLVILELRNVTDSLTEIGPDQARLFASLFPDQTPFLNYLRFK